MGGLEAGERVSMARRRGGRGPRHGSGIRGTGASRDGRHARRAARATGSAFSRDEDVERGLVAHEGREEFKI